MASIERKLSSDDIFVNILRIQTSKIELNVLNFRYRILKLFSATRYISGHTTKLAKIDFVFLCDHKNDLKVFLPYLAVRLIKKKIEAAF